MEDREWFLMYRGQITTATQPGILFVSIIHPQFFPMTPYYTRCFNFTHRIEVFWEFEIMITSAVTTGVRVAAIPVDDPSPSPLMNDVIAFQQVANGRAAIATVTGTVDVRSRVGMVGTTVRMSNGSPLRTSSIVGFSVGSIFLYLLDPPIGINTTTVLNVTLLARVGLREFGPFTGFMGFEVLPPGPAIKLTINNVTTTVGYETHHGGSGYLDGNRYMAVLITGKPVAGTTWDPTPRVGKIYTCVVSAKVDRWRNTNDIAGIPKYYCVGDLGSGDVVIVGFSDITQAKLFISQPYSVRGGAALGLGTTDTYSNKPWKDTWDIAATGKVEIFFPELSTSDINLAAFHDSRMDFRGTQHFALTPPQSQYDVCSLSSVLSDLEL